MLKKLLIALGAVVALLVLAVAAVYAITTARMHKTYALNTPTPPIPSDSASIERGRHIAEAISACTFCHGERLEGKLLDDAGPVGEFWAPNLTRGRGGVGGSLTHAQWVNAIRRGIDPRGRSLKFMPAEAFQVMSDEDVGALVAYLERLPPVDHEVPPTRIGPLGRMIIIKGKSPFLTAEIVDHSRRPAARVERGVTPAYGYYLARLGGCIGCHGRDLAGRRVPGAPASVPPASNLTPAGIGHYTEGDFIRALRDGRRPDGRPIDPFMPLSATKRLTDDEVRAIYAYLRTVPPREFGTR